MCVQVGKGSTGGCIGLKNGCFINDPWLETGKWMLISVKSTHIQRPEPRNSCLLIFFFLYILTKLFQESLTLEPVSLFFVFLSLFLHHLSLSNHSFHSSRSSFLCYYLMFPSCTFPYLHRNIIHYVFKPFVFFSHCFHLRSLLQVYFLSVVSFLSSTYTCLSPFFSHFSFPFLHLCLLRVHPFFLYLISIRCLLLLPPFLPPFLPPSFSH